MSLRVAVASEDKCHETRIRSEGEPEEGVKLAEADAKPSDLHLSRLKSR